MFILNGSRNISPEQYELVSSSDKEHMHSHKGIVIWMTGYSGSGKTTLAYELERRFYIDGVLTKVLDGDVLRRGLNKDLGYSIADRTENTRRTAELAKQLVSCGIVVICSLITPTNALRLLAETIIGEQHFILYHISTPLEVCEKRDVKGHYAKARSGELKEFTGVSDAFEEPNTAIYSVDTTHLSIKESVDIILDDIFPLITI